MDFSYILGIFTGLIIIDEFYSCKPYSKIKKYTKKIMLLLNINNWKLMLKNFRRVQEKNIFFEFFLSN